MSMCSGWRQDKPPPYQLVAIRELSDSIDHVHIGYWNGMFWCALSKEKVNGDVLPKGTWTGIEIVRVYGWQDISKMEPNVSTTRDPEGSGLALL